MNSISEFNNVPKHIEGEKEEDYLAIRKYNNNRRCITLIHFALTNRL